MNFHWEKEWDWDLENLELIIWAIIKTMVEWLRFRFHEVFVTQWRKLYKELKETIPQTYPTLKIRNKSAILRLKFVIFTDDFLMMENVNKMKIVTILMSIIINCR